MNESEDESGKNEDIDEAIKIQTSYYFFDHIYPSKLRKHKTFHFARCLFQSKYIEHNAICDSWSLHI